MKDSAMVMNDGVARELTDELRDHVRVETPQWHDQEINAVEIFG